MVWYALMMMMTGYTELEWMTSTDHLTGHFIHAMGNVVASNDEVQGSKMESKLVTHANCPACIDDRQLSFVSFSPHLFYFRIELLFFLFFLFPSNLALFCISTFTES